MRLTTHLVLATCYLLGAACSQSRILGDKADARDGNQDGTGGANTGGALGSGGGPGTGGRGTGGAANGGDQGSGGGPGSGGRLGSGGNAPATGGAPGTGGQGTGGGGNTDGGTSCAADATFWCASGRRTAAGGISCGDALMQPACTGGVWTCPTDWIPMSDCDCAGLQPTGCQCTPNGLSCPDGGADAAAACNFGCYPVNLGGCGATGMVAWQCSGPSPDVSVLTLGGCAYSIPDAMVFCCPSGFLSHCPPRP